MKPNPYLHAFGAVAYIGSIALLINFLSTTRQNTPDTVLDGVLALSLLVFSVAVMAFLFFYCPVVLLVENRKPEAIQFFLKTLGTFGGILLVVFIGSFFIV